MYKEIEVDINLYHLLKVLSELDNYSFDSDITKILNNLKKLVDEKIFSNTDFYGYDIINEKMIIKFILKKQ